MLISGVWKEENSWNMLINCRHYQNGKMDCSINSSNIDQTEINNRSKIAQPNRIPESWSLLGW
jgi:hypothetical protein